MLEAKTEKEIAEDLLNNTKNELMANKIEEKYLVQQTIIKKAGSSNYELSLGVVQRKIRELEKRLTFLDGYLKELK